MASDSAVPAWLSERPTQDQGVGPGSSPHPGGVLIRNGHAEHLRQRRVSRRHRRDDIESSRNDEERAVRERGACNDYGRVMRRRITASRPALAVVARGAAVTRSARAAMRSGSQAPRGVRHRIRRRNRNQGFRARLDDLSSEALDSMVSEQMDRAGLEVRGGLLWTRPSPRLVGLTPSHEHDLRRRQLLARQRERRAISDGFAGIVSSLMSAAPVEIDGVRPGRNAEPRPLQVMPGLNKFGSIQDEEAGDGDSTCVVCMHNKTRAVLAPCGHMCMCKECVAGAHARSIANDTAMRCPICRDIVVAVTPLHCA